MNTDFSIEEDLRHMLAAAGRDTAAPTDLMDQVKRGHGRRRGRHLAALTGAAVLLLSAGIGLTAHLGKPLGDNHTTATTTPTPSATTVEYHFRTTDWSAKAFRMPATLAGDTFSLVGMLDSRHVLVVTSDGFEHASTLVSYDVDTHATATVTDLAVTGGLSHWYPQKLFLDDKVIAWWTIARAPGGAGMVQFWAYDRATSTKHVVATLPDTAVRDITVIGDQLFFADHTAVYRLPLTGGGTPELVAGSNPWVIVLDGAWAYSTQIARGSQPPRDSNARATGTLLNVVTGESRIVTGPAGAGTFVCNASWCTGHLLHDKTSSSFAMRVDGSDVRVFPSSIAMADGMQPFPMGGHFELFNSGDDQVLGLVDLASGENGALSVWVQNPDGSWAFGPNPTDTPTTVDSREAGATSRATQVGPLRKEMGTASANPAIIGWPTPSGDEIYVLPLN